MPELPEVETIKKGLSANIKGKKISSVELLRDNIFVTSKQKIKNYLPGKKLIDVKRRAKLLIFKIESRWLVTHLRMSGSYITQNSKKLSTQKSGKFTRFVINFTDGSKLLYQDQRTLGKIYLFESEEEKNSFFKNYGLEPLEDEFTHTALKNKLAKRAVGIKQFLLDQKEIVGIGNIYASEILFKAKIHPFKAANNLKKNEVDILKEKIIEVLQKAIKNQGTTFSDYRQSSGKKGNFQNFLAVYKHENDPCPICNNPIKRVVKNQRSTYFCQKCQN